MKTIDESNIIEEQEGLVVNLLDNDIDRDSFARMTFRMDIFCSIPIFVFEFSTSEQTLILPVRFWESSKLIRSGQLKIRVQIFNRDRKIRHEREFLLTPIQAAKIQIARIEQNNLKPGQLDAIEDYIYSDFIGIMTLS